MQRRYLAYLIPILAICAHGAKSMADPVARTGSSPMVRAALEQERMSILPTLKGHMARLGTLMNVLFRNIDDPARAEELIGVSDEMITHLRSVRRFTPFSLVMIGDPAKYAAAETAFQACLNDSIAMLTDLKAALRGSSNLEPRPALLKLDKKRRDCHAAFG